MFITKECDYAVRIIRMLSKGDKVTVRLLCKEENVPHFYAYKILNKLEKSKFVQSKRGSLGGYSLLVNPNDITLYDVVLAVDCEAFLASCVKNKGYCSRNIPEDPCKVHKELCRLQAKFIDCLKERTLAQILV
jgi:Rrf2 family protein